MKEKLEVGTIFQTFDKMIKIQFKTNIKVLRSDNGRDYYQSILKSYL